VHPLLTRCWSGLSAPPAVHPRCRSLALQVTLDLAKLNASFSCKLCGGYLRDAHTLMDCLHTVRKTADEQHTLL